MEDNYKTPISRKVQELGTYVRELYAHVRSLAEEARSNSGRLRLYGFSDRNATYGTSSIPANGGYERDDSYARVRRKRIIVPVV